MAQAYVEQKKLEANIKPEPEPLTEADFENTGLAHIGNNRAISVYNYKGFTNISIREYYRKDGKLAPGRRGINLTPEQWRMVTNLVDQIDAHAGDCQAMLKVPDYYNHILRRSKPKPALKRLGQKSPLNNGKGKQNIDSNKSAATFIKSDTPQLSSYEPSNVNYEPHYVYETVHPIHQQSTDFYRPKVYHEELVEESQNMNNMFNDITP